MPFSLLTGKRADLNEYARSVYIPELPSTMLQTNMSDGKSDSEDPKRSGTVLITPSSAEASEDGLGDRDAGADRGAAELAKMGSKRALIAWMILCYSVRPPSHII